MIHLSVATQHDNDASVFRFDPGTLLLQCMQSDDRKCIVYALEMELQVVTKRQLNGYSSLFHMLISSVSLAQRFIMVSILSSSRENGKK